ncbi:MAG TPA: transglycosylase domain-containing protein, partial [Candidatus Acidoferrales bacterium]|nr:transglycosylase domain-containing protein [Candidatus Acidoferrales bacterium]
MAEIVPPLGRGRRLYRWLAAYFRAAIDPTFSNRARIISGVKGLAVLGALGLALVAAYSIILIPFTPSISNIRKAKIDQPSILVSSDGKRLATFRPMNREWVGLNRISPNVINALIATEDHRFYQHYGIDLLRTVTG